MKIFCFLSISYYYRFNIFWFYCIGWIKQKLSENLTQIFISFMQFYGICWLLFFAPVCPCEYTYTHTHTHSPLLCLLVCRRGRAWRRGSDLCGRRCRATTTPASPLGSRGCRLGVSPSTWSRAGPALAAGCFAATPPTPDREMPIV